MALPRLGTKITVPSGGWSISVTEVPAATSTVTIPAGDYYMLQGATGILATLEAQLNANATLAGNYIVTCPYTTDTANGKVSISMFGGATSFTLTWTSTDLRDALGWTGNLTPTGVTFTSQGQAKYIFFPNCGRRATSPDITVAGQTMGMPEFDYTASVSPSGSVATAVYGTRYRDQLEWPSLKGYKTWKLLETTTNESFQTWLVDLMAMGGGTFRYFPDRSSDTVYAELVFDEATELRANPFVQGWAGAQSLWSVGPYSVRKKV